MREIKFYLDKRRARNDGRYLLKLVVGKGDDRMYFSLKVNLYKDEWDAKSKEVVKHPDANYLNIKISNDKKIVKKILEQEEDKPLKHDELKKLLEAALNPEKQEALDKTMLFEYNFLQFANKEDHANSTKDVYMGTHRHLQKFMGEKLKNLSFEDITEEWLKEFDNYLKQTSEENSRRLHMRNIRAVVKDAIKKNITKNYPFYEKDLKPVETFSEDLNVEEVRQLFEYKVEEHQQKYLDIFKLMFFLCGINMIDLYNLKEIVKGRIQYGRSKTNKKISIKVEPEAMEIIEKYKGTKALLNIADHYANHKDFLHRMNENLQRIGPFVRKGRGGKKVYEPLFPKISSNWARHIWGTMAYELHIPIYLISATFGHKNGSPVTKIYIHSIHKLVDEANRKVIDYVLYNKKEN